ncbi:MAG: 5-formyltetrahydrofolate cyclo-ligase, partial [Bacteroidia bacterium]
YHIPEPKTEGVFDGKIDMVLVPLLAFDEAGFRVGYGKGFYDDFFTSLNSDCIKIGVNFFPPCEEIDDLREKDIALDYLVTPAEVLSFGLPSKSTK